MYKIINGDSFIELKELTENSVDSVVCDPPYGLSFMGKKWDYDVPTVELWKEVIRVLKPGGHLLSFAGSRTYHRMAVNIEDAGFEIRDQIMWVYGQGFAKGLNIGKAVDKLQGNERELVKKDNHGNRVGSVTGGGSVGGEQGGYNFGTEAIITKGTSPYEGWGTALKPAHEPICMARKPLSEKTVALNVLKWGTGGINIEKSRVGTSKEGDPGRFVKIKRDNDMVWNDKTTGLKNGLKIDNTQGRFPANFIHDGSDEVVGLFPETKTGAVKNKVDNGANQPINLGGGLTKERPADSGSASRFFYCAKASKKDRNEGLEGFEEITKPLMGEFKNNPGRETPKSSPTARANFHPTIKPTSLMQYLVRLVTPKGGTVLDPFAGSFSTGKACVYEGFDFIGIELDKEYCAIGEARMAKAMSSFIL